MELKDVIHFYLNPFNKTKILVDDDEEMYLWDIDVTEDGYVNFTAAKKEFRSINHEDDGWMVYNDDKTLSRIKPILRRLSSMTEKESWEIWKCVEDPHYRGVTNPKYAIENGNLSISTSEWAAIVHILISKHFDLFSLIESNQAIDRDTI